MASTNTAFDPAPTLQLIPSKRSPSLNVASFGVCAGHQVALANVAARMAFQPLKLYLIHRALLI